ncbi:fumarylacetoacetase [Marinobacterium nitratireducens]|uniref:fumarylacetoacetase n=1 Tax=Marinobacterium nitratireducens TaxID=518897 RepID=A0A917Z5B6_9GAMM|nr:fumarylacetoacetase [Marinobacterium nitratireducens]GGO75522.1 fumarylacetoacetase [Marinobacterium nitratireducens]
MTRLNETHDSSLTSWVASANGETDFPIQNLPFASFRRAGSDETFRGGVAIGDQIVDLAALHNSAPFDGLAGEALAAAAEPRLNRFMGMGQAAWSALRLALSRALRSGSEQQASLQGCLIAQTDAEYGLPCSIGDYTDFYTSVFHATSVGALFRPDNPLLPNYKWVPIGYHGRASSIGVSGQKFPRPQGQTKAPDATEPSFGPCKRLDYELEIGIFIGAGNELGEPVSIDRAEDHVFGICLFNDWSARDIQAWEYQPLGPFLSKNFASTISPWIVTMEALAPYRTAFAHPAEDPQPLPYLSSESNSREGALDIQLECLLQTEQMRNNGEAPTRLSESSFKHSYWTVGQMVAHHTVNGCNLQPGDLLGSGTQSGPEHEEAGSLLELTVGGKQAISLPNGETRTFLEDGDAVVMRGYCAKPGAARIGFGEVVGTILPARV